MPVSAAQRLRSVYFLLGLSTLGTGLVGTSCQKIAGWATRISGQQGPLGEQRDQKPPSAAERNAQILQEIYRVVRVVDPSVDPRANSDFAGWLDSLNQGASYEGVYNAFTHSKDQRKLESEPRSTASPAALNSFAKELSQLLLVFKEIPEFTELDPGPLAEINPLDESALRPSAGPKVIEFAPLVGREGAPPERPTPEALAAKIATHYTGSSVYTLKRVLGDWALRAIEYRRAESPERLWEWYADFAVALAQRGVEFGIRERNDSDRTFHRNWAQKASEDLLRWEVLNRLHRILNAAQPLVMGRDVNS
jgi:hypothetical protein